MTVWWRRRGGRFYTEIGAPRHVDGRFDMIVMHAVIW
jgi:hypothetical protein